MKAQLRNQVVTLILLAPLAVSICALPADAIAQVRTPEVRSFDVNSDNRVAPGSRLRFRLEGTPRAQASVRIPGVAGDIALREVERGIYVGRYLVTGEDRIEDRTPIRGSLKSGNRTTTVSYNFPVLAEVAVAPVAAPLPLERFTVVRPERLEPVAPVAPVADPGPPEPAAVPLQILSHANNGEFAGAVAHVRGRTAPFATVAVRVQAAPPAVGHVVAQQVFNRTLQADANGDFEFSFASPFSLAGVRYDVTMLASKANVTNEAHLILYQRQG